MTTLPAWSPSDALMVTVAPTGAELSKADWPQLPASTEELVTTAQEIEAAGASLIHVHIRDAQGQPSLDPGQLAETVAALRESSQLIVQLSTGGSVTDSAESRLAVLDARPDSCSLTCGTVNFGTGVFMNPWSLMVDLHCKARDLQVVPEFEIFDVGQLWSLERLLAEHGLPFGERVHVDLVMGVPGGMPATAQMLATAVSMLPAAVTSWSATGIGRGHLPIVMAALAHGGHVRVGMEDNVFFARKRPVTRNAEFVTRVAALAELCQRPLMTPAQARTLLAIPTPG